MYQGNNLYSWNWVGGGYNQVRANSRREALRRAREIGRPSEEGSRVVLEVNESSLRRVRNEESFWNNYPMFD